MTYPLTAPFQLQGSFWSLLASPLWKHRLSHLHPFPNSCHSFLMDPQHSSSLSYTLSSAQQPEPSFKRKIRSNFPYSSNSWPWPFRTQLDLLLHPLPPHVHRPHSLPSQPSNTQGFRTSCVWALFPQDFASPVPSHHQVPSSTIIPERSLWSLKSLHPYCPFNFPFSTCPRFSGILTYSLTCVWSPSPDKT